jgi:hypothetical protein
MEDDYPAWSEMTRYLPQHGSRVRGEHQEVPTDDGVKWSVEGQHCWIAIEKRRCSTNVPFRERKRACRLHRDCAGFPLPFTALLVICLERSSSALTLGFANARGSGDFVLQATSTGNSIQAATGGVGEGENMLSWRRCIAKVGALCCTLTAASPSVAQSGSTDAQAGVVIFWNAAKCMGGYHTDLYSAHCEPGPAAAVLDFKTKTQFSCVNNGAVDIRWAIPADPDRGAPIPPSQIDWRPECWKTPLGFDVDPNATILTPQYSQSPPPNYYMTMNVVVLYVAAKPTIKVCLVPLFPRFPVEPACADAQIRS